MGGVGEVWLPMLSNHSLHSFSGWTCLQESLVAKCRALNQEGLTCYHLVGSSSYPPSTVTGSIQRDLLTLETCVGAGELAVSDHRSSAVTGQEIARLARYLHVCRTMTRLLSDAGLSIPNLHSMLHAAGGGA